MKEPISISIVTLGSRADMTVSIAESFGKTQEEISELLNPYLAAQFQHTTSTDTLISQMIQHLRNLPALQDDYARWDAAHLGNDDVDDDAWR